MNADAIATRMSVLTRALPMRVLLIGGEDGDAAVDRVNRHLAAAGFEVLRVGAGESALEYTEQHWFPVIIAPWRLPEMDAVQVCAQLRARGVRDTYVILIVESATQADYERGYAAGVDDFLAGQFSDADLFARMNAAFNTLALRRSLQEARGAATQDASADAQAGILAPRDVYSRLNAELHRAQRYRRPLTLVTVGVQARGGLPLTQDVQRAIAESLSSLIRTHIDWVGRIEAPEGSAFAVVLPEAGTAEGATVKQRFAAALERDFGEVDPSLEFSYGVSALDCSGMTGLSPQVGAMIEVAERCRRCAGRVGAEQLATVRESVSRHVSISCRHGYAVDHVCPLYPRPSFTAERAAVE
jgi:PleD family two-component response regulator